MDHISTSPTNAEYTVNGKKYTSPSNHITIDNFFEADLVGISKPEESVTLGLKADADSLTDNVSRLLGGYNNFMQAASAYLESQSNSGKLVKELKTIASDYETSMSSTGLTLTEEGILQINEEVLRNTAVQSDDIAETFSYLKEFSDSLLRKSRQVSLNPMDYVKRTMVAYKNPSRTYVSPYHTSAYSGMMFNSYC